MFAPLLSSPFTPSPNCFSYNLILKDFYNLIMTEYAPHSKDTNPLLHVKFKHFEQRLRCLMSHNCCDAGLRFKQSHPRFSRFLITTCQRRCIRTYSRNSPLVNISIAPLSVCVFFFFKIFFFLFSFFLVRLLTRYIHILHVLIMIIRMLTNIHASMAYNKVKIKTSDT